jgi:hypothetical protein
VIGDIKLYYFFDVFKGVFQAETLPFILILTQFECLPVSHIVSVKNHQVTQPLDLIELVSNIDWIWWFVDETHKVLVICYTVNITLNHLQFGNNFLVELIWDCFLYLVLSIHLIKQVSESYVFKGRHYNKLTVQNYLFVLNIDQEFPVVDLVSRPKVSIRIDILLNQLVWIERLELIVFILIQHFENLTIVEVNHRILYCLRGTIFSFWFENHSSCYDFELSFNKIHLLKN